MKKTLVNIVTAGLIGLSNLGLLQNARAEYDFINHDEDRTVVSATGDEEPVPGDDNDLIPFKNWAKMPRFPAIDDNWLAFVQNPDPNYSPSAPFKYGDVYVIYQGPLTEHKDKKIRITNTKAAGISDVYGGKLVYCMGAEDSIAPHWPSEIYLTDLSKINLDNLIDLGDGTYAANESRNVYERCITCGISNPDNPGNLTPQINEDKVVWRTGYYKPYQDLMNNHWKEIWMYDINEEIAYPISNVLGDKYNPSIDGEWVVYPVHEGVKLNSQGKWNPQDPNTSLGQWNVYGYNTRIGKEFLIDNSGGEKRTVSVYDDHAESAQTIVAYGKHWGELAEKEFALGG